MRFGTLLIPPLIAAAGVGLWLLPDIVHSSDGKKERVTIEQLIAGHKPATRNLAVEGTADVSLGVTVDVRKVKENVSTGRTWMLVPVIPASWTPSQPVHLLLKAPYYQYSQLGQESVHEGVVRNVLWEGLRNEDRDFFERQGTITLAPDVVLLDAAGRDWSVTTCCVLIFGAFVLVLLAMRAQLQQRRAEGSA